MVNVLRLKVVPGDAEQNWSEMDLANGSRGIVGICDAVDGKDKFSKGVPSGLYECPVVLFETGRWHSCSASEASWRQEGGCAVERIQLPLKLAWALTIHKSQGLHAEKGIVQLEGAHQPGQGFVAISRLVSLEGQAYQGE